MLVQHLHDGNASVHTMHVEQGAAGEAVVMDDDEDEPVDGPEPEPLTLPDALPLPLVDESLPVSKSL